jgi:cytochrome oxidase assembly protein ShyY1
MIRRLPAIPTLIVAAAAAVMIGLGIWQLQRAQWKEGLIARYAQAGTLPPIAWPATPPREEQLLLFRHATGVCLNPVGKRVIAGRNLRGESGYAQIVDCRTGAEGPGMSVEVGWSKNPNAPVNWRGGPVSGIIAPDRRTVMRLVAASPAPGLQPSAPPGIEQISNNHRLYAAQWFIFAALAMLIYGLALRRREAKEQARS